MSTNKGTSTRLFRVTLILFALVNIYPLVFTLFTSFKTRDEFYSNLWGPPGQFHTENYLEAFQTGRIGDYLFNSIVIAIITLTVVTVLGMLGAYALARLNVPKSNLIVGLLLVLMILPPESMIIPLYMMMSKLHFFDVIYLPIVVGYIGWLLPGAIVILRNFFLTIPNELLESARMDGCGELNTMFRIVFPLSGPAVATITVFNFAFVWGELMWAQIATLTTEKGIPISVGLINFQGQFTTNWGLMTAAICLILIPLIVVFIFLQKYFVRGLTSGGVKG